MDEITCKFQQLYEHQTDFGMESKHIPLPEKPAVWHEVDTEGMTVNDFLMRFTGRFERIPVVLRVGNIVVSNTASVRQMYHKVAAREGLKIFSIEKVEPSDGLLRNIGFV